LTKYWFSSRWKWGSRAGECWRGGWR
jgi:hypothetical protein